MLVAGPKPAKSAFISSLLRSRFFLSYRSLYFIMVALIPYPNLLFSLLPFLSTLPSIFIAARFADGMSKRAALEFD